MPKGAFAIAGRRLTGTLAGCALMLLAASVSVAAASASEGPRWVATVVPTPTNLAPESPHNAENQLTVEATGGTFRMELGYVSGLQGRTTVTRPLPYDAEAAEVEAAVNAVLEKETFIRVQVTGGPGGTTPYTIVWTGSARERSLETLEVYKIAAVSDGLTGGRHTATVTTTHLGWRAPQLRITVTNVGGAATDGSTIALQDVLPAGVTATAAEGMDAYRDPFNLFETVTCEGETTVLCTYPGTVDPGDSIIVTVTVSVGAGLPTAITNDLSVTGGGAEDAEVHTPITVSTEAAPFGVAPGSLVAALSSRQAGQHANVTTGFAFTTRERNRMVEAPKDVRFRLPRGLVGNTVGIPRCLMSSVIDEINEPEGCASDTAVGMATVTTGLGGEAGQYVVPVRNIAPAPGEPAAFGFDVFGIPVRLDTRVMSNGEDEVRVDASDLTEASYIFATFITMWGIPADHNGVGPDFTLYSLFFGSSMFGGPGTAARVPLLTNPQQCSRPLTAGMSTDSWSDPGAYATSESVELGTLTGCEQLRLSSKFTMLPDTLEAGAPAGYHFDLEVPQNEAAAGLGTPNVKNVRLKLPLGTVVNPSAAWGLRACSAAEFYGPNHPSEEPAEEASCPRESQVGQVWIKTPALAEALEGQVFLAEPKCGVCTPQDAEDGDMVRLYVQAVSEGESGIVIKLEGYGKINQQTGQIEAIFKENPQLPFSEFKLKLSGGPRAVLANPRACGVVSSSLELESWDEVLPVSVSSDQFEVNDNCFGPQFHPSFKAGMPNVEAGENGEFMLAFGRPDDSEYLKSIAMKMPEGLMGSLVGIPLCKEAQANAGTCSPESLLGSAEVLTGPGADPFLVEGGKVYLTEGYGGSQFGLSIVVPAVAGPYTLAGTTGRGTVVVRSQIFVDPHTAQLTILSGEIPSMLDGIPLQLKAVNVRIDRPHFTFNPTSCEKMAIAGTIGAVEGMTASVASPFQVTNCASLAFKPTFKASTSGKTSKADGASLHVKVQPPAEGPQNAPGGSSSGAKHEEANIHTVKVELPKQLPSRLTTLQKACTAQQFDANPAGCPAASRVGSAIAHTPILDNPLTGPAYFVSRGNEAFPQLIVVLQGEGVTVDLAGDTFISKQGITSSTFKEVPDVPVSSFELTLPQGPNSALAVDGSLCVQPLLMPTEFTGQNGAQLEQNTVVEVEGCSSAISISSHKIKNTTVTLKLYVPAAGKVRTGGAGLGSKTKIAKGRETLTINTSQTKPGKLKTKLHVLYTPKKGKQQTASLALKFKK